MTGVEGDEIARRRIEAYANSVRPAGFVVRPFNCQSFPALYFTPHQGSHHRTLREFGEFSSHSLQCPYPAWREGFSICASDISVIGSPIVSAHDNHRTSNLKLPTRTQYHCPCQPRTCSTTLLLRLQGSRYR